MRCRGAAAALQAPRPKAVKHRGDPVEQRLSCLDVLRADIAPGERNAKRGARLRVGTRCGRKPREPVTALTAVAFRHVQGDRAERATKLLAEVAVVVPDPRDGGPKDLDRVDREVENEEP